MPLVPLAINGTSWLKLGRRVRIRVGVPLVGGGRPTSEAVDELTAACAAALEDLVRDAPELAPPGPVGRRLTELFNEWPEGRRPPVRPSEPAS